MAQKSLIGPTRNALNSREEVSSTDRSNQDYNYQYYEEFKKLYDTKLELSAKMKALVKRKEAAWGKLSALEKRAENFKDQIRGEPPEKKKRTRRMADEIEREFQCSVERCNKSYGTQGSLYQHIKLKHPQLLPAFKRQRSMKSQESVNEQSPEKQERCEQK